MNPLPPRLASLDAYRGLAMTLLLAETLEFSHVAEAQPGSPVWEFLAYHQTHVPWTGCSLHDLIQPSFTFMVGVSLPFSLAARTARGESRAALVLHAFWRAAVLVLLGVFLRSLRHDGTYWTFEDTLTQIGLGYGFLFLVALWPMWEQVLALVLILVGYATLFALYPLPPPDFDWQAVGVPADWPHHPGGFAAHWDKNSNAAWAFDRWFLNLFPRDEPFVFNRGGYATLSAVPTLGTMILGLLAGGILKRTSTPGRKFGWLVLAAAVCFALGLGLGVSGVCPIVKRIWTPAWTLFSGGWCFVLMAALYAIIDAAGFRGWAFPLVVVGMNSIVAYCMDWGAVAFARENLTRHFGSPIFERLGPAYQPLLLGTATLAVLWLVLWGMYRRRMFVRI